MDTSPITDSHSQQGFSNQDHHDVNLSLNDDRSVDVYGNIPLMRDDIDESDGQRRSLSLDDDGGTHFDISDNCLETVVRRVRDDNLTGASFQDAFNDNDVLFNPAQRLNFDEDDDEDDEERVESDKGDGNKATQQIADEGNEDDNEVDEEDTIDSLEMDDGDDEVALVVQGESNEPEDGSDYFQHRPWVSGSDLVEENAPNLGNLRQSSSQNVRIIEGHDSSLVDDGNPGGNASLYGYNFLQSQMGPLSPLSLPQSSTIGVSDSEAQNLYDSLEREALPATPYGEAVGEDATDVNTSEYYSLTATNSNGNISDSFWHQEEVSLQRNRTVPLPAAPSHSSNQNLSMVDPQSREQSPPRNFQMDHMNPSLSSGRRDISQAAFLLDGNVSGPSGFSELSHDPLNMELSEEGLSQSTQIYAQPLSNPCNLELAGIGGMTLSDRGDHSSSLHGRHGVGQLGGRIYVPSTSQQANVSLHHQQSLSSEPTNPTVNPVLANHSVRQPRNLAQSAKVATKPHETTGAVSSGSLENQGGDMSMNQRQEGAGSSTSADVFVKTTSGKAVASRSASGGAITKKSQFRRPAVQGSASGADQNQKRSLSSSSVNSQSNNSANLAGPSGNNSSSTHAQSNLATGPSARINTQGARSLAQSHQGTGAKPKHAPTRSGISKPSKVGSTSGHAASSYPTNHMGDSPLTSRTNSHASLVSIGSSNSRVGGVGKESHQFPGGGGGGSYAANQQQQQQLVQSTLDSGHLVSYNNSANQRPADPSGQSKLGSVTPLFVNPQGSVSSVAMGHQAGAAIAGSQHLPPGAAHHLGLKSQSQLQRGYHHNHTTHYMQELHAGDAHSPHRHPPYSNIPGPPGHHLHQHQHQHLQQMQQQDLSSGSGGGANVSNSVGHNMVTGVHPHLMGAFGAGPALSPSGSESSRHSYNREAVVTQMESMKKGMNQSTSSGHEMASGELQSIEDVRSHLHSMLNIRTDNVNADYSGLDHLETASELMTDQPINRQLQFDTNDSSLFGNKAGEDMSEILENFPAFSSKMFSDMSSAANKSDSHVHSENQYLRESLEKERYRRKHCEDQIQRLNTKLLEIQQQLAVAISTDKRKDSMIEQLDKQLAKVVEGWKKREADKDESLKALTEEKGRIEESLQRQQAMINNFEHDLAQTVDELKEERTKSSETILGLRKELSDVTSARDVSEDSLRIIRKKCDSLEGEWDAMKASQTMAETRAQQAQEKLVQEQDAWAKKEQEMSDKISQVKDANQKVINMEKVKCEEHRKKREVAESEAQDLKAELKRLVLDTEQLVREKESQKMEASIMEAKFESAQRKLEADLHTQMEKEIADQAKEFHARLETAMEEANERHRGQVADIHKRHQKDLERQMAQANNERERKEDDYKRQISDLEGRLSDIRNENSTLKQTKLKLESQRMEILTKLQFMMQSQWNEAVSLLVSTPQKKNVQGSFLPTPGGLQLSTVAGPSISVPPASSLASFQALVPSTSSFQHKHKMADRDGADTGGRASSTSSSGREKSEPEETCAQLDRVEEYLHQLKMPSDAVMLVNNNEEVNECHSQDTVTSDKATATSVDGKSSSQSNQVVTPSAMVSMSGEPSSHTHADSVSQRQQSQSPSHATASHHHHHHQHQHHPGHDHILSLLNGHHHGSATSQGLPPSTSVASVDSSQVQVQAAGFQAMPIRAPQQLSRIAQNDEVGVRIRDSSGQLYSFSDLPFKNNNTQLHPLNLFPSQQQHQQQQQHAQHHHHHPHRGHNYDRPTVINGPTTFDRLSPNASSMSDDVTLRGSGDSGDQINLPQFNIGHHNPNLFLSGRSPVSTSSSPSGVTSSPTLSNNQKSGAKGRNAWSNNSSNTNAGSNEMNSPSPSSSSHRSHPSVKGHSFHEESPPATVQWSSRSSNGRMGNINASLSPPVRQTAEKDLTADALSEINSGVPDARLDVNYSQIAEQMEDHSSRHEELQHYIQLLLQKAPGSVSLEPERDIPHLSQDMEILESSRDLTVDMDLNDTAQAHELTLQLNRLHELRERQQLNARSTEGLASINPPSKPPHHQQHMMNFNRPPPPERQQQQNIQTNVNTRSAHHLAEYIGDNGVMNAQGLSEISQLLNVYREQWEANPEMAKRVDTAGRLIEALKGQGNDTSFDSQSRNDSRKPSGSKKSPRGAGSKKSQDLSGNKTKKKASNQMENHDVSIASSVDSWDKSKATNVAMANATKKSQESGVKDTKKVSGVASIKQTGKGGPAWK